MAEVRSEPGKAEPAGQGSVSRRDLVRAGAAVGLGAAALSVPSTARAQQPAADGSQSALEHINPEGMLQSPVFSQGIVIPAGSRVLVIAGQDGVDASGTVVSDDLGAQTVKALDNLLKVLETAGGRIENLVRVAIYLKGDIDITPGFNAWMERWGQRPNPPTVVALRVAGLAVPDALIEIEATAVLP